MESVCTAAQQRLHLTRSASLRAQVKPAVSFIRIQAKESCTSVKFIVGAKKGIVCERKDHCGREGKAAGAIETNFSWPAKRKSARRRKKSWLRIKMFKKQN